MPTYEYKCSNCEHLFEQNLKIVDRNKPEKKKCPNCGQKKCVNMHFGSAPGLHSGRGMQKPDNGFKEVMQKIAQHHPRHTMNIP